jgi:bifunctional pyridoxal-dependent enzyme with beta-cystathionase and maltose regulon repressor activities
VVKAVQTIADFSWISSTTDTLVTKMLEDETWVDWFLKTNQRRLAESYEHLTQFLRTHNINYLPAQAGSFIWIDLRSFLPKPADQNPQKHAAEVVLYNTFLDHGIYIAGGEAFHTEEEGWFRLTFAVDWDTLHEGLRRMVVALGGNVDGINGN